jgi:formylglycine-generating enzyme required for sulfatase activity/class 3 adenylate cyclase
MVGSIDTSPRRLAAVLAADVSGFSRLMEIDEESTLARLKRHRRELIEPTVQEHYGRIVKTTGDGFLAEFNSPVEAVRCAIVIQQSMTGRNATLPREQRIVFRIGVNLGDIIIDADGDIYGDGVNVASRIEALCEPGQVYISGGVYEQIKNKLVVGYQSLGDQQVKNITDPVHVYRVLPDLASVQRIRRGRLGWVAIGVVAVVLLAAGATWYLAGKPYLVAAWISAEEPSVVAVAPEVRPIAAAPDASLEIPPPASSPGIERSAAPPSGMEPQPPTSNPVVTAMAVVPVINPVRQPVPQVPFRDCPDCPEMVLLPGGAFEMGSNEDPTEKPTRRVTVAPFAIGRYPVTVAEWNKCVSAGACTLTPAGEDRTPVHNVSWTDAQDYARWLAQYTRMPYRLPSEAEWEYAARAGSGGKYWWGDALRPRMANCKGCGDPYLAAQPLNVGSLDPNRFGLHDMGGNVAQWVQDCWHRSYQGGPVGGQAWDEPNCRSRVLRGGHWRSDPSYVRPASRSFYDVGVRYPGHGLRVARSQ